MIISLIVNSTINNNKIDKFIKLQYSHKMLKILKLKISWIAKMSN